MNEKIFCIKLKKHLQALNKAPFPGSLGEKIKQNVSSEAWKNWLNYQVILINENNLSLIKAKDRLFLKKHLMKYFFFDK